MKKRTVALKLNNKYSNISGVFLLLFNVELFYNILASTDIVMNLM